MHKADAPAQKAADGGAGQRIRTQKEKSRQPNPLELWPSDLHFFPVYPPDFNPDEPVCSAAKHTDNRCRHTEANMAMSGPVLPSDPVSFSLST